MGGVVSVVSFIFLGAAFFVILILSVSSSNDLRMASSDAGINTSLEILDEQAETYSFLTNLWFPIIIFVTFLGFVYFILWGLG